MNCPSCNIEARRLGGTSAVRCWICDACKSIAAEIASLRDSVPRERVVALEKALRAAPQGDRKCPRCVMIMARASVRGGYGIMEIDGCTACRIVWFESGELRNLQSRPGGPSVQPKLSEMTPEERSAWRVEQLREDAKLEEQDSSAAIIGILLGIPLPEPVRGYRGRAYVTWALCLVIVGTSFWAFRNFDHSIARFGMLPEAVREGEWSGLLTHFFLHADVFHLFGNLLFLFIFGSRVEALIGGPRYLALVAVATIAGALVHTAFAPDPTIPLIGASGGISGVLAAHACLRPRAKVRMMFFYRIVAIPAVWAFVLWIVLQLLGAAAQMSGTSAVSALGHLGGAAAGFVVALGWKARARLVEPTIA